jgi:hypothetical protein
MLTAAADFPLYSKPINGKVTLKVGDVLLWKKGYVFAMLAGSVIGADLSGRNAEAGNDE